MKTLPSLFVPAPIVRIWLLIMIAALVTCGAVSRAAAPVSLRAGPLTMMFEPDNAFLRYINAGPHELLRGINAPVRNRFWGTVLPKVSKIELNDQGDHFSLTFEALCQEREIDFLWRGAIKGSAKGEIEFTFDGVARSDFLRNRIGFCVLHGPSAAGKPWRIENVGGGVFQGRFPDFISPHQPAKEIREISHELAPGLWARVRMEGDTFEMEDQRNWTDASFKTYCTPLALPYPARVSSGTRITQKVTVRLEGSLPASAADSADGRPPVLVLGAERRRLPRLGLQVSSQSDALSEIEVARLKALNLDHLRVDLSPASAGFQQVFARAAAQANALGAGLHAGVRLGADPEAALESLGRAIETIRPAVSAWFVLGADARAYRAARESLKRFNRSGRQAPVAVAHDDINFTQLNRVRPEPDMLDLVVYGVTPQIHAFDNLSIVETLPILADTVRSARQFIGASPLFITPVTLRLQTVAQPPPPGELPSNVDPRQPSLFAAAWTLGSLKYLAEAGVESITYYETVGWKGIMETAAGAPLPAKFPSQPGAVFPLYDLLLSVGEFAGGEVQRFDSSDTLKLAGLALRKGAKHRFLVANLSDRFQPAIVRSLGGAIEWRHLTLNSEGSTDQTRRGSRPALNAGAADLALSLPPYGIIHIDAAQGN